MPESTIVRTGSASFEVLPLLTLEETGDGRLLAERGGQQSVVHVRRCFPWSEPDRFISLRDVEGDEFALVSDPRELDDASRAVLETALGRAGFVFTVTGVHEIEEEVELRHWRVETQQGARKFQTRLDEWPRRLPDGGFLIRDVTGDLYRFVDPERLDMQSRSLLWAFID
jgi:hypothetical protein